MCGPIHRGAIGKREQDTPLIEGKVEADIFLSHLLGNGVREINGGEEGAFSLITSW